MLQYMLSIYWSMIIIIIKSTVSLVITNETVDYFVEIKQMSTRTNLVRLSMQQQNGSKCDFPT